MKITLQSHGDYMKRMFSSMTIRDAQRHSGFFEALYATEAWLVEQARKKAENPTEVSRVSRRLPISRKPIYIIAPAIGAVN